MGGACWVGRWSHDDVARVRVRVAAAMHERHLCKGVQQQQRDFTWPQALSRQLSGVVHFAAVYPLHGDYAGCGQLQQQGEGHQIVLVCAMSGADACSGASMVHSSDSIMRSMQSRASGCEVPAESGVAAAGGSVHRIR